MLIKDDNIASFLIRRICRIVPLAWVVLICIMLLSDANWNMWKANLFFYANLPPIQLLNVNGHFWSLCVEMQFYGTIALLVAIAGRWGLALVPFACLAVTVARIAHGVPIDIVTWWRIDEILAGGCLALAFSSPRFRNAISLLPPLTPFLIMPILIASSHPAFKALNYGRPYFAAILIGSTILRPSDALQRLLCGRILGYLAEVSYALYVIHPLTYSGWLGEGDAITRYTKRIGSFFLSFLFAHFSTRYYEKYWIALGHRVAKLIEARSTPEPVGKSVPGSS
jgi:peptidoglycan/LPS O-acetylase OafA/YrhL